MAGPVERVQMKDGSVLKLNAEDKARAIAQGLVGKPTGTGAARPPGPDDPEVFYDDGSIAEAEAAGEDGAETESKAVAGAPENKAITSARVKGK
jgi:hypothetical protein